VPPIERALLRTVPWLIVGLIASLPLLVISPSQTPLSLFTFQLVLLVVFSLLLTFALMSYGDEAWFVGTGWGPWLRSIASGVALVVLVTGTVGLITLASSAAIGFDPSLQYLQLLSALDIAWVVAAVVVGVYRATARSLAVVAGSFVGIICIWSIWNYLNIVGFGPGGAWIGFGPDLIRYVIPADVISALIAVGLFLFGVRAQVHETEQPSPQS